MSSGTPKTDELIRRQRVKTMKEMYRGRIEGQRCVYLETSPEFPVAQWYAWKLGFLEDNEDA